MQTAISERLRHWKSILAVPKLVRIVGLLYAAAGAVTWGRDELIKHNPNEQVWHVVDFLTHWTPWQWGVGAAVILVAVVLETSFQRKQEAITAHAKEVGGLQGQISGLKTAVERLEERMKEGPSVVMANVGTGINLRVESLKQDAINVRLAQANTKNYFINADVIRLLKVGAPETLVLHRHPQQAGGSLVLQGFFFPDAFL
jgi:hypothetical protein